MKKPLYEESCFQSILGNSLRPGGPALTRRGLGLCSVQAGQKVADIGCGLGTTAHLLREEYGLDVVAVDPSPAMRRRTARRCPGLTVLAGEARHLPLAESSMDGVVAECVLSLTDDLTAALAECRRVLRLGGWLLISDVYAMGCQSAAGLPSQTCLSGARSLAQWQQAAEEAGLIVDYLESCGDAMRQLAVQIIWAEGSLENFWRRRGTDPGAIRGLCPGYFLLAARRGEESMEEE